VTQKIHEKKRNAVSNLCWQSVQDPCLLCSKIADVHGIEVHDVRTWKFVFFSEKFPIFITQRDFLPKMAKFVYKNTRQSVVKYQSQTIRTKCYWFTRPF